MIGSGLARGIFAAAAPASSGRTGILAILLCAVSSACASKPPPADGLEREVQRLQRENSRLNRELTEIRTERDRALVAEARRDLRPGEEISASGAKGAKEPDPPEGEPSLAGEAPAVSARPSLRVVHLGPDSPEPASSDEVSSPEARPVLRVHGVGEAKLVHIVDGGSDVQPPVDGAPGQKSEQAEPLPTRAASRTKGGPLPQADLAKTRAVAPGVADYEEALSLVRSRSWEKAIARLSDFLKRYPAHPYSDNALYWRAECHYAQGNYAEARSEFAALIERYPHENKVPDALLKLGYAAERLGDEKAARLAYGRLVRDYPNAPASSRIPARFLSE